MAYEALIGWRYLYGGRRDTTMVRLAVAAFVVALIGLGLLVKLGPNPIGLAIFVTGLLGTAVFGLFANFSIFVSVSILGVAFGVAALTIVLAVTSGMQDKFREKVLGVNAHVIVLKEQSTFAEYRDVMRVAKAIDPDVMAAQPFIYVEMLVTRGKGELSGVAIKGVDPALVRGVLDLDQHMIDGKLDALAKPPAAGTPAPIIIGKVLAQKLKAKVGDTVTVVVPLSNINFENLSASTAPRTKLFRIVGIFYSGFADFDQHLMYAALPDVQTLIGRDDQVMGVEMKIRDLDRAAEIADKLETKLGGPPFQVQDWAEMNKTMISAMNLQKVVLVVILTLIIVVAAVNMVSALTMMVTDKTREIAIVKSMGGRSGSVARIFVIIGLVIGGLGTVIGVIVGLSLCVVMSHYGFALDPKVYLIDRLPIDVQPFEVGLVCAITMAISMLATIAPAMSASSLRPVEGLRYD